MKMSKRLIRMIEAQGVSIHYSKGIDHTILKKSLGDTTLVDVEKIRSNQIVENVLHVQELQKPIDCFIRTIPLLMSRTKSWRRNDQHNGRSLFS